MNRSSTAVAIDLIQSTTRAFYDDEMIVIVDLLIREPYFCKKDDISTILRMKKKTCNRALDRLQTELIVQSELIQDKKKMVEYCFINYRFTANIIRYRFRKLTETMDKDRDTKEVDQYKCPILSHGKTFLVDQLVSSRDKNGKFFCPDCCPFPPGFTLSKMKTIVVDSKYYLNKINKTLELNAAESLHLKIRSQLITHRSYRPNECHSISSLLSELNEKTEAPSTNLPSRNKALGKGPKRKSEEVEEALKVQEEWDLNQEVRRNMRDEKERQGKIDGLLTGSNISSEQRTRMRREEETVQREEKEKADLLTQRQAQEEAAYLAALYPSGVSHLGRDFSTPQHLLGSGVLDMDEKGGGERERVSTIFLGARRDEGGGGGGGGGAGNGGGAERTLEWRFEASETGDGRGGVGGGVGVGVGVGGGGGDLSSSLTSSLLSSLSLPPPLFLHPTLPSFSSSSSFNHSSSSQPPMKSEGKEGKETVDGGEKKKEEGEGEEGEEEEEIDWTS